MSTESRAETLLESPRVGCGSVPCRCIYSRLGAVQLRSADVELSVSRVSITLLHKGSLQLGVSWGVSAFTKCQFLAGKDVRLSHCGLLMTFVQDIARLF